MNNATPAFEPVIGIDELSELLGIPKKTIYLWCQNEDESEIPNIKLGKHLKFRLSSINNWLQTWKANKYENKFSCSNFRATQRKIAKAQEENSKTYKALRRT